MPEEHRNYNDYDLLRIFATMMVVIGHSAFLAINTENGGVNYCFAGKSF